MLVVAADSPQRLGCVLSLHNYGYEVFQADGPEAMAMLERCRPAIIVLDLNIGSASAAALLRRASASDPTVPGRTLLLSRPNLSRLELAEIAETGIRQMLLRPFPDRLLLARVTRVARGLRAASPKCRGLEAVAATGAVPAPHRA